MKKGHEDWRMIRPFPLERPSASQATRRPLFGQGVLEEEAPAFLLFLSVLLLWKVLAVLLFSASYAISLSKEQTRCAGGTSLTSLQQRGNAHTTLGLRPTQCPRDTPGDASGGNTGHALACFWKLERSLAQQKMGATSKTHPSEQARRKEEPLLMR